jgi:hypothetical protein
MAGNEIRIPVQLSERHFRNFALYDRFVKAGLWKRPVIFAAIFTVCALICLFSGRDQSVLLGTVLLVVGLGLPAVWVGSFLVSVHSQARKQQLGKGKKVYTVVLRQKGICVLGEQAGTAPVEVAWGQIADFRRGREAWYLYVTPGRAFILPDGQGPVSPQETGAFVAEHINQARAERRAEKEKNPS